ncbi:MAG TPA: hypothetical protein ENI87_13290 [bacterium]|nr:hypothetical protein [bacterium]
MGILCKGTPANIWFVIDSPTVAALKEYVDATRAIWLDEVATAFSRLPLAERQRLIASHDERARDRRVRATI